MMGKRRKKLQSINASPLLKQLIHLLIYYLTQYMLEVNR